MVNAVGAGIINHCYYICAALIQNNCQSERNDLF